MMRSVDAAALVGAVKKRRVVGLKNVGGNCGGNVGGVSKKVLLAGDAAGMNGVLAVGSVGNVGFDNDGSVADGSVGKVVIVGSDADDGLVADGSVADGSVADGSVADGSVADGSVADGSVADGSVADGSSFDDGSTDGDVGCVTFAESTQNSPSPSVPKQSQ